MSSTSYHLPSTDRRSPRRIPVSRRAIAFVLALLAHILIFIILLNLSPARDLIRPAEPKTFRLLPDQPPPPPPESVSPAKVKHATGGSAPKGKAPPVPTKAASSPAPPTPAPAFPKMLAGGMDLFEAGDIAKLPSHAEDRAGGGNGDTAGIGKDSHAAYGPGEGPGGERLYDVDWYRRPTDAELSGYLPNGAPPGGWALIACRMVEDYRVENCRSLGESPVGSGLARAMRQAAWQFRVLPPRVGGKKVLGGWVRIRIDFSKGPAR